MPCFSVFYAFIFYKSVNFAVMIRRMYIIMCVAVAALGVCEAKELSGDAEAWFYIAEGYDRGTHGLPQDYARAFEWYAKAARAGHPAAMTIVGFCYEKGMGTEVDPAEAFRWYKRGARKKNYFAMEQLALAYERGIGTKPNPRKALEWFGRAADAGNHHARYEQGRCYEHGIGTPPRPDLARRCYEQAAAQGIPEAVEALESLAP